MRLLRRAAPAVAARRLTIACAVDPSSANSWYRALGPLEALERRGHVVRVLGPANQPDRALRGADLLHIHRFWDETSLRLAARASERGIAVVWDEDDDFSAIERGTTSHRRHGGLHGARRTAAVRRMLSLVDVATTTGPQLAATLRSLGAGRVETLPNYVGSSFARQGPIGHDGVVVGWVAGLEHQLDLERLSLRRVFGELLDRRRDVRVATVGVGLGLRSDRYTHRRIVPFAELPRSIAGFDVAVAPLADVPFNRARSDVKLKEYSAVGIPWLASPVGPYRGLGSDQGGLLVGDREWGEALERMLSEERLRRHLARRARRWGLRQTIDENAHRWETLFRQLADTTQSRLAPR